MSTPVQPNDERRPTEPRRTRPAEDAARQRQATGRASDSGGEAAAGRLLVTSQLSLPGTDPNARERRRSSADLAQLLIATVCGDLEAARRIVQCGRAVRSRSGVVLKRSVDGYVYASGLVTCGSPWSCLACSYKIRAKRARHIAQAVAAHLAAGGGVLFGTFTMSHDRSEALADLWRVLSGGWAHVTAGRQWVDFKAAFGLVGNIKSVEVTHGGNGWHPHLHVLFFIEAPMNDFDREHDYRAFRRSLRERWIHWFATKAGRNVSQEFGIRFEPVKPDDSERIGIYCTKVGYELAMADTKIGRAEGHRHPFAIAHDAARYGDKADVMLLREWIVGSKRKRSIHWSGDTIKAYVADDADVTDVELAQEEQIGDQALLVLDRDLWRQLISRRDGARAGFLRLFETGGDCFDALYYLAELGIGAELNESGPLATLRLNQPTNQARSNHGNSDICN